MSQCDPSAPFSLFDLIYLFIQLNCELDAQLSGAQWGAFIAFISYLCFHDLLY